MFKNVQVTCHSIFELSQGKYKTTNSFWTAAAGRAVGLIIYLSKWCCKYLWDMCGHVEHDKRFKIGILGIPTTGTN